MEPGTIGVWDGERWTVADEEIQRPIDARLVDSCRPNTLLTDWIDRRATELLASHVAAALADPNLGDEAALLYEEGEDHGAFRAASKALAGYLLQRLSDDETDNDH